MSILHSYFFKYRVLEPYKSLHLHITYLHLVIPSIRLLENENLEDSIRKLKPSNNKGIFFLIWTVYQNFFTFR